VSVELQINAENIQSEDNTDNTVTYTQIFPVIEICGHRCGLHMTATTAICTMANSIRIENQPFITQSPQLVNCEPI